MKTQVIIQFDVEGFHCWENAIEEVQFLKHEHRHTFTIRCGYEVDELDREREIFVERHYVKSFLEGQYLKITPVGDVLHFGGMSCEMIAKAIMQDQGPEMRWCEVWEEKTGGARVER
jgi:hypothetical protein